MPGTAYPHSSTKECFVFSSETIQAEFLSKCIWLTYLAYNSSFFSWRIIVSFKNFVKSCALQSGGLRNPHHIKDHLHLKSISSNKIISILTHAKFRPQFEFCNWAFPIITSKTTKPFRQIWSRITIVNWHVFPGENKSKTYESSNEWQYCTNPEPSLMSFTLS